MPRKIVTIVERPRKKVILFNRYIWPLQQFIGSAIRYYKILQHDFLKIKEGDHVLEVGIGRHKSGFLVYSGAVGKSGKFVGIDKDPKIIAHLQKWKDKQSRNEEFKVMSAEKLKFKHNSFDKVIFNNFPADVPEHLLQPFKEAKKVLKKGGKVFFSFVLSSGKIRKKARLKESQKMLQETGLKEIGDFIANCVRIMMEKAGFKNIVLWETKMHSIAPFRILYYITARGTKE